MEFNWKEPMHPPPTEEKKAPRAYFPDFQDFQVFRFSGFSENDNFCNFPMGFVVWEGLQWIGNGCGLQMDGFSAHFEPSESSFDDFHDFGNDNGVDNGVNNDDRK